MLSGKIHLNIVLMLATLIVLPASAYAQQDLSGYAPPSMFGGTSQKQIPVAPAQAAPVVPPVPAQPAPVIRPSASAPKPAAPSVAASERINPKPLTNALMGIDDKAATMPLPVIKGGVIPKADMRPTAGEDGAAVPSERAIISKTQKALSAPAVKDAVPGKVAQKPVFKTIDLKPVTMAVPPRKPGTPASMNSAKPQSVKAVTKPAANKSGVSEDIVQAKKVAVAGVAKEAIAAPTATPASAAPAVVPAVPLVPMGEDVPAAAAMPEIKAAPPINTVDPERPAPIRGADAAAKQVRPAGARALPPPDIGKVVPEPVVAKTTAKAAQAVPAPGKAEPVKVAAAPALPPMPKIVAKPEERKDVASIEPPPAATLQMLYRAGDAGMSADGQTLLQKQIIPRLSADPGMRLQIIAYATAMDESQSSARRISLNRALAVRDYLKAKNVAPYRMDIRAMGDATASANPDRVDLLLIPVL